MFIVAKNKYIEELYQYDQLTSEEEAEHLLKLPAWDLGVLWQADLFPLINCSCDVMITDYHLEIIPYEKLPALCMRLTMPARKSLGLTSSSFAQRFATSVQKASTKRLRYSRSCGIRSGVYRNPNLRIKEMASEDNELEDSDFVTQVIEGQLYERFGRRGRLGRESLSGPEDTAFLVWRTRELVGNGGMALFHQGNLDVSAVVKAFQE